MRRALLHRTDQAVLHHPGVEERPDEFEYTLVGNPCRDARHQTVVIDSVEGKYDRLPIIKIYPKSVVITRKRYRFEGCSLAVITSIRRRGVRLVLVILPNGTREQRCNYTLPFWI